MLHSVNEVDVTCARKSSSALSRRATACDQVSQRIGSRLVRVTRLTASRSPGGGVDRATFVLSLRFELPRRTTSTLRPQNADASRTECKNRKLGRNVRHVVNYVIQTERAMTSAKDRVTKARPRGQRRSFARAKSVDPITSARVEFALTTLAASGKLKGSRTERLSARVDPGLIKAARTKTGLNNRLRAGQRRAGRACRT